MTKVSLYDFLHLLIIVRMQMQDYANTDEYLANFPDDVRQKLETIRSNIKEIAPTATEKISYGIPTFTLNGKNLVHFAAYKTHIGFYPGSAPIAEFANELKEYKTSKGTVQLPLNKPLPLDLIRKITEVCIERNS